MSFTHLYVRSGYTFMESTITIPKLVERAKQLNFTSIALTDHHVLYGAVEFYKTCKKYNIKPIIGMSVTLTDPSEQQETALLLAKNNAGYKQLVQLSTFIQSEQIEALPWNMLQTGSDDLIVIVKLKGGYLQTLLAEQKIVAATQYFTERTEGLKQVYLGIDALFLRNHQVVYQNLRTLLKDPSIVPVAIHEVVYLHREDYLAYESLQAMKVGRRIAITEQEEGDKRYLLSKEEMITLHEQIFKEAIERTEAIANMCQVTFDFNQRILPAYPVPEDISTTQYLQQICIEQLEQKYETVTDEMTERLTYELSVIDRMNFNDYFLIVWDFVKFAKEKGILVGPGRGSAAGSFVAYLLGITDVDPLKYNLLFERFLNPERQSMPDIDIDFADHRRDEVIAYVRKKYGKEHVAQIITFGTFGARSILRELFKTFGTPQRDIYVILNNIPAHATASLRHYLNESKALRQYIKQSYELRALFKIALTLEGLPRHASTHAAGVIISDEPLQQIIPLTVGANGHYMTQYAMDELEALGLLKIDFLGLRNLSLIERMIHSIQRENKHAKLSIGEIPAHDEQTFKLLQKGQTDGVFQLESSGMKDVLRQLKPTSLEDIIAVNALYRPGPMQYIQTYVRRKHGQEKTTYLHDDMKPILRSTYGVLVYQEQMIQIVHHFTKMTLGEADIFRRTLTSHHEQLINEAKQHFITRCIERGYLKEEAEKIFNWLKKFSNYSFNRSHAVAYSKISYQLAYFKAHYPTHFYAQLLSAHSLSPQRMNKYVMDMRKRRIELLPPSINRSYGHFSVENNHIRMGLLAIKGIGYQGVKEIINKRLDGPFKSLFDFCFRVSLKVINRQMIEHLIKVGAFDDMFTNRASLLATLDDAINQAELFKEFQEQPNLLEDQFDFTETYRERNDFSPMEKLTYERELLGLYVSSHPLKDNRQLLAKQGHYTLLEATELQGKGIIKSIVMIDSIRKIRTRHGEQMAFLVISDEFFEMDAVVFPNVYEKVQQWLKENIFVRVIGKTETRNNQLQFVVQAIEQYNLETLKQINSQLFIKITTHSQREALAIIQRLSKQYPGMTPIYVHVALEQQTYKLDDQYRLNVNEKCLQELQETFGQNHVVLKNNIKPHD